LPPPISSSSCPDHIENVVSLSNDLSNTSFPPRINFSQKEGKQENLLTPEGFYTPEGETVFSQNLLEYFDASLSNELILAVLDSSISRNEKAIAIVYLMRDALNAALPLACKDFGMIPVSANFMNPDTGQPIIDLYNIAMELVQTRELKGFYLVGYCDLP
jgi:hypothetical protein